MIRQTQRLPPLLPPTQIIETSLPHRKNMHQITVHTGARFALKMPLRPCGVLTRGVQLPQPGHIGRRIVPTHTDDGVSSGLRKPWRMPIAVRSTTTISGQPFEQSRNDVPGAGVCVGNCSDRPAANAADESGIKLTVPGSADKRTTAIRPRGINLQTLDRSPAVECHRSSPFLRKSIESKPAECMPPEVTHSAAPPEGRPALLASPEYN
jgi:hypothetical protein